MIQDLMRIYYEEEKYHKTKLSRKEAERYFKALLEKGRLLITRYEGSVVAYAEVFRINKNQLQRIIMGQSFFPCTEDINNGDICYINALWVDPEHRNGLVSKELKRRVFFQNRDCKMFCGHRNKKTREFKVYRRNHG